MTLVVAAFLMGLDAILHPPGARIENVRDETRRKKDAQSGEPVDGGGKNAGLATGVQS